VRRASAGTRRTRQNRDERGAILIMSTIGMVVAIIATALSVDLGALAQERRRNQKVADMAALDAVHDLAQRQPRAEASAVRNGFPTGPGYSVVAELGKMTGGTFALDAAGDAVRVTVASPFNNAFMPGSRAVSASAVASATERAGFTLGSSLATVTPSEVTLLGPIIGRMIGGSSVTGVGWAGLASGNVTLEAIRAQLVSMGFTVGSPSQLLDTELTLAQLYQATASALTLGGDTANADAFNILRVAATNTTKVRLSDFLVVDQGAEGVAMATRLNLFQLVSQSAQAQAFNGSHAVTVDNVGITVPNVLGTRINLSVIEPPKTWIGREGTPSPPLSTGQINLTISSDLNLNVTVAPLTVVKVTNRLPVRVSVAGAKGYIKDITCGETKSMTVNVDPSAFSGSVSTVLRVSSLLGLPLLDIPTTSVVPSTNAPAQDVSFSYPNEFVPPPAGFPAVSKQVGSQPVGLGSLTQVTAGTPTVLGLLPVPAGTIVTGVLNALGPVIGNVDNLIVTPLLDALGVSIGNADVTALVDALRCGDVGLVA
jgi:tight adherence protein G